MNDEVSKKLRSDKISENSLLSSRFIILKLVHWLVKLEISRRALITRARDPIGGGRSPVERFSERRGEAFYVGSLSRARERHETSFRRYKEGAG